MSPVKISAFCAYLCVVLILALPEDTEKMIDIIKSCSIEEVSGGGDDRRIKYTPYGDKLRRPKDMNEHTEFLAVWKSSLLDTGIVSMYLALCNDRQNSQLEWWYVVSVSLFAPLMLQTQGSTQMNARAPDLVPVAKPGSSSSAPVFRVECTRKHDLASAYSEFIGNTRAQKREMEALRSEIERRGARMREHERENQRLRSQHREQNLILSELKDAMHDVQQANRVQQERLDAQQQELEAKSAKIRELEEMNHKMGIDQMELLGEKQQMDALRNTSRSEDELQSQDEKVDDQGLLLLLVSNWLFYAVIGGAFMIGVLVSCVLFAVCTKARGAKKCNDLMLEQSVSVKPTHLDFQSRQRVDVIDAAERSGRRNFNVRKGPIGYGQMEKPDHATAGKIRPIREWKSQQMTRRDSESSTDDLFGVYQGDTEGNETQVT